MKDRTIGVLAVIGAVVLGVSIVPNQGWAQTGSTVEIWAEDSEISQAWDTVIKAKICPRPIPDVVGKDAVEDPETGQIVDPGSEVVVSLFLAGPNDSDTVLFEQTVDSRDWCTVPAGWGFTPEEPGLYTFYATAEWSRDGIVEIRSDEVTVLVKPAIFSSGTEVLAENPVIERLLDWSADGESILASYYEEDETGDIRWEVLALMSTDGQTVEKIEMPGTFNGFWNARFSPSGDSILIVAKMLGEDDTAVFSYSLDGGLLTIAESRPDGHIDSAVWLDAGRIAYGEEFGDYEEGEAGYALWVASSDGTGIEKLYEFTWTDNMSMEVNDSKDGKSLLLARIKALGFPRLEHTLFVFDVETKESAIIPHSADMDNPRFSPAGDIVLYDIGLGYRTPGGPIEIVSIDGTLRETLDTGQKIPGDNPSSFVVSPDGRYVVALGTIDAKGVLTRTELAHPMPEFGAVLALVLSTAVACMVVLTRFSGRWRLL